MYYSVFFGYRGLRVCVRLQVMWWWWWCFANELFKAVYEDITRSQCRSTLLCMFTEDWRRTWRRVIGLTVFYTNTCMQWPQMRASSTAAELLVIKYILLCQCKKLSYRGDIAGRRFCSFFYLCKKLYSSTGNTKL